MDRYRIKPGQSIRIKDLDPDDTSGFDGDKKAAKEKVIQLVSELNTLQELLYAESKHKLLVVLQGMDTSGKDGVIRQVFEGVNPQGVRVASFKAPTPAELSHDYLWRIHQQVPTKGELVIFNRSHYEDVLIVRVHKLVSENTLIKRYSQICDFERMLSEEGVTIIKFFLHISPEEQKSRLEERLKDPTKRWKFNPADLDERKLWDFYMKSYEDVLNKTSTEWAPWYFIPANRNWFRNLVIVSVLVSTLKNLNMNYPQADEKLDQIIIE